MTCAQGLLRLLWGGARSWSATGLGTAITGHFIAASIWEILSLTVWLTRDLRRTNTHQLAEHEDCIKGKTEILLLY